jgi:DNA primase small subunit
MDERTRLYLRGRFGDHYRRTGVTPPPDAHAREWGYIPWTAGPDTTMVRHRSMLDLGDLATFLADQRPRHVYFSAGRYDDPGASTMESKGWLDSDLIFDLDADHLPAVELGEDSYGEMLAKCKDELLDLLEFLEDDFAFEDVTVAFSGGRGYHVHVRDDRVRELESDERREIVDYVRGTGLEFEALLDREVVGGEAGRQSPAEKRLLPTDGGWGRRVHDRLLALLDELLAMDRADAVARLQEFEGFGERKAEAALSAAESNYEAIEAGNVDVHSVVVTLARELATETAATEHAHIDEPVTTDTNRLIRLPGSLHGGTGLAVTRIERGDLADFDPLTDAVPETFTSQEVAVDVADGGEIALGTQSFTISEGVQTVPEYVAVFLMARGRAEKARE